MFTGNSTFKLGAAAARLLATVVLLLVPVAMSAFTFTVQAPASDSLATGNGRVQLQTHLSLNYRINSSTVDSAYMDNSRVLGELSILLSNPCVKVDSITISSYSSPEGGLGINLPLSVKRSSSIVDYLESTYPLTSGKIQAYAVKPDFADFTAKVEADPNVPYRDEVLELVRDWGSDPDARFTQLQRLRDGEPYDYVRRHYLPWMRNSSLIVFHYSVCDETARSELVTALDSTEQCMIYEDFTFFFELDKYNLDVQRNAARLLRLRGYLQEFGPGDVVTVRSYASPEGPKARNQFLSDKRAQAIIAYLDTIIPAGTPIDTISGGENWQGLAELVQDEYDRDDKEKVLNILNSTMSHEQKKAALRRLSIDSYNYIVHGLATRLRTATVTLRRPCPDEPEPEPQQEPEPEPNPEPVYEDIPFMAPRREMLALRTNLLFYGFYMPAGYDRMCPIPNAELEFFPRHGHFTLGASLDFPWWQNYDAQKYFQIRNYVLYTKFYLRSSDLDSHQPGNGRAFSGLYIKGYVNNGLYDICLDADNGVRGEALGGGLGIGYMIPLSQNGRWSLNIGADLGYMWSQYDPYQWEDPQDPAKRDGLYYYKWMGDASDFKWRQYRFQWLGPTRVEISLTYNLLYRRNKEKGAGLRRLEQDSRREQTGWLHSDGTVTPVTESDVTNIQTDTEIE